MLKLILHEDLPARIAGSPFLQPVLQVAAEVGKSVRGPSTYEVTGVYLEEEYKEIQEWVNSFKPILEERSVTIMCDGWKGTRNQHIINLLIYSPRDTEAVIKVDGKMLMQKRRHLYWSACFAHCLDVILEEIGNRKSNEEGLDMQENQLD
ncbi:hypothetical protein PVK06_007911 [Gossypium arboreum]|uniref:DUF659 domain-containing protein n=1 Tax=Gossypium arboreum TaxID=29729 RepID=A0ABR0QIK9_GOSAR|nr:hypothetical protein PVK06_007911 [Gossypium arboreum]